jgi:hypothetical protein
MKKLEHMIERIDNRVDKSFGRFLGLFARHFTLFSTVLFAALLGLFVYKAVNHRSYYLSSVIAQDIENIAKAIAAIDKDCSIMGMESERLSINFLTVKSFVGQRVGGLALAYPQKWQGPYLQTNPTFKQHCYDLVQTGEGLFIIPGRDVQLPNGLVMDRDVKIDFTTSIKGMLAAKGPLNHNGSLLGLQLNFKVGLWEPAISGNKSSVERVNGLVEEFNQAMPFAKNDATVDLHVA